MLQLNIVWAANGKINFFSTKIFLSPYLQIDSVELQKIFKDASGDYSDNKGTPVSAVLREFNQKQDTIIGKIFKMGTLCIVLMKHYGYKQGLLISWRLRRLTGSWFRLGYDYFSRKGMILTIVMLIDKFNENPDHLKTMLNNIIELLNAVLKNPKSLVFKEIITETESIFSLNPLEESIANLLVFAENEKEFNQMVNYLTDVAKTGYSIKYAALFLGVLILLVEEKNICSRTVFPQIYPYFTKFIALSELNVESISPEKLVTVIRMLVKAVSEGNSIVIKSNEDALYGNRYAQIIITKSSVVDVEGGKDVDAIALPVSPVTQIPLEVLFPIQLIYYNNINQAV